MSRNRGFTLIELLVVIAIIVLLAALLLPVFASVRERGRQAACSQNLKEIGVAYPLYAGDWDETYPFSGANPAWNLDLPIGYLETITLAPYLNHLGHGVWICPSDPNTPYFILNDKDAKGRVAWDYYHSYSSNEQFLGNPGGCEPDQGRLLSTVRQPSDDILEIEGYGWGDWPKYYPGNLQGIFTNFIRSGHDMETGSMTFTGYLHSGKSNYLFADGHVRAERLRETLIPVNQWDDVLDWCPDCQCSDPKAIEYMGYPQSDVLLALQDLDQIHYPG